MTSLPPPLLESPVLAVQTVCVSHDRVAGHLVIRCLRRHCGPTMIVLVDDVHARAAGMNDTLARRVADDFALAAARASRIAVRTFRSSLFAGPRVNGAGDVMIAETAGKNGLPAASPDSNVGSSRKRSDGKAGRKGSGFRPPQPPTAAAKSRSPALAVMG
jgi:hypothetical protein